ncbi:hypothetical protein D0C16_10010 [Cellvibrio sp. KY-GH-1]|nr:hypothetical protein D0C16_10010 [Cellvibrio sp. KY-GH-1]
MRPTRVIPPKTGAKGITFAPCPETLWLIECSQFLTRRAVVSEFGEIVQNLNAIGANYPTSGELYLQSGSDKKTNSLILRACEKVQGESSGNGSAITDPDFEVLNSGSVGPTSVPRVQAGTEFYI